MALVRQDEISVYIILNGSINRPGEYGDKFQRLGYEHRWDMSDGGLKMGDKVKVYHVSSTPFIRIKLPNKDIYWIRTDDSPEMKRLMQRTRKAFGGY